MTSVKEWIEGKIMNEYIRHFKYDEFSQIDEIGTGHFGKVSKAILANTGLVALKVIFRQNSDELNEANDEFVKELKLLREVDYHPKINRCLGITEDSGYYILVLEYANEGNLRNYLKKKSTSLKWNDKIQMALDITSGLKFLHSKEIIHRDLHSKNILVNNGKLLIADLGLSKKLAEVATNSKGNMYGMIEYVEPQCFKNIKYKKDKKSDIYSLGVLLWEISSGRPPFSDCSRNLLSHYIEKGNREEPFEGTPPKYQELYQKCWDGESESRPDIEEVHEILSQLNIDLQPQPNIHNINDKSNSNFNDNDDLTISTDLLNNLQQKNSQFERDNQNLKLNLATQIKEFAEKENNLQTQITHLRDEKQTLADNLTKQLEQNKLADQQVQIQVNQLKQEKNNLQDQLIQKEADIQNLRLDLATQIEESAGRENTLETKIASLQNEIYEKKALADDLTEQLEKLTNQQVQIQINQLRQEKSSLQEKLIQTEGNFQELKSLQEEQKKQLEIELIQSQVNCEQIKQENIKLGDMVVGLSQNYKLTTKLKAELEKK
ncbi:hypothetical protein RclHR1_01150014 [Rhizophagus clarus]|uniref:Protein kinase domain-containing protein n=1 Tax=Rhizophagus clarus TaxID=94130 RepID=A0A2Z6Q4K0_9GLOM|nr:hypothetical protein RclHR1_01150014 [Rhizophagus clarus]